MAVVRKLSMMVEFKNNAETAMNQANRNMDKIKVSAIDAERSMQRAGQSAGRMGTQYRESSQRVKKNADEMRNSADQTAKASEKIRQLDRQLELQKTALHASTAGLSEMGRGTESVRRKASGLSEVVDLQRQKVIALRDRYAEMKNQTVVNGNAMHRMRVRINEESAALGELQGKLIKTNLEARHLRKSFINLTDRAGNIGTNYLMTVSAPIAYGLTKASKASMDFGQQMKLIQNEVEGSGLSAKQVSKIMNQVSSDSKKWSGEFGKSTDEVNEGMLDIVRDGYSAKEVMGTLPTMLAAARGSAEDLKTVTVATTGTLEQFGQKSKNAGSTIRDNNKITNGFMVIANKTKATIGDLGESFSIMGSTMKVNHQSIADAAAAVGELRSRGIDASTAGTSLRAGLVNMVKPTKAMRAAMKDMNLTVTDSKGNMKSLPNIIDQLRKGTDHMTSAQKNAHIATLTGKESLSVWSNLIEAGSGHLRELSKAYDTAGNSAEKMSDKMNKTPLSKLQKFQSTAHNLGIEFGDKVLPVFTPFIEKLTDMAQGFAKLNGGAQKAIVISGLVAAAGVPIIIGLGKAVSWIIKLQDHFALMRMASKRYQADMLGNAAATEGLAAAENSAANAGVGVGGVGGTTGAGGVAGASTKSKKRGIFSRIFRRGGASAAAGTAEDVVQNASKGGRILKGVGTGAKWLGRGVAGLGIATSLIDLLGMTKNTAGSHIGSALGSMGGTWGGAAGGAALGTMILPGVGTVIGGGIGAGVGSFAGSAAGKWAGGKIQGMFGGGKKTPAEQLDKGTGSTLKSYENLRAGIDTKLGNIAASGSKYSEKTKKSIDKAYDAIAKGSEASVNAQQKTTKAHFDELVKDGLMSAGAAKDAEAQQKRRGKANVSLVKDASKQLKNLNNEYYEKTRASSESEERKLSDIRRKYGTQSAKLTKTQQASVSALYKKYQDKNGHISAQGLQKVNTLKSKYASQNVHLTATGEQKLSQVEQKYSNDRRKISAKYSKSRLKLEETLQSDVAGAMSNSAKQQKIILGKLKSDSGKLSVQQASTIVKQAHKARDGSISAANKKYKKVMSAADQEYFVTGSISKKQYETIKEKAEKQRDSAVSAANEQWNGTVKAAKKQATGHADQVDWETGKVLGFWDKMGKGIAGAWNWFTKLFTGKSAGVTFGMQGKKTTTSTSTESSNKSGAHAYANGTSGHPGGNAILGDGGKPELWFTPQGAAGISPATPTFYQDMPAGTQVLNGEDTERTLGAKAYAKGTSGFWSSISDFLGKGYDWIKGGAASASNYLLKKAGVGSIGDLGDLTQFTKKTAMPAVKKLLGSAISNVAHSSGMGDFAGVKVSGNVKQWIAAGMKLAGVSGGSWAKGLATIAQRESGGNPNAVNRWDSNAKAGHPSAGLMQMIKSTFMAHAVKGHTNWGNPIDQVAADVNYINARYGGISRVPGLVSMAKGGKYVGYAKGTQGAGNWFDRVFGKKKKKDDPDGSGNGSVGVVSNRPITINAPVTINIKVDGGDANVADKVGRQVREEIEKVFKNLTSLVDPGVIS